MMQSQWLCGCILLLVVVIENVQPLCVLESDFGFKINCAFKKSGLFRVRNLGGLKAHASIGFSLGDELGFEQSLTNQDPSRRRSVSVKNGAPPNLVADTLRTNAKQEKRGKQNRIMMRPVAPPVVRPNQAAMDKLTSLHRRMSSTMEPIIVSGPTVEAPTTIPRAIPTVTMAKPMGMGIPAFRPLPPKEEQLKVLPITAKTHQPLQVPQSKGPGLAYQSEIYSYPQSHNQISQMVSHMTATQYGQHYAQQHGQNYGRHHPSKVTSTPIVVAPIYSIPTTMNPFVPMPISAPPTQALAIIPAPAFKPFNTPNPSSFLDPVPHQVHNIASNYAYNTKKVDDYNSITGYSDDTTLKFNKEDINSKIAEIAKAGNISMEAVEAAIALRQQQLLNKYANLPIPTTTSTTTTQRPVVFEPEPEIVAPVTQKPKRVPTTGKVMNAPREYYPVGYEKNFDDQFQSKVELPDTSFHCGDQKYFPGLYGDEHLGCMVFHVCALTDDGLVMKSFLCPESTLFDQTILKCNWWFYVDCKNTRKLYDTNIPVSKSYQLMKALTFFSSYKKEMEDGRPTNPEDMVGIKEAISILENQDSKVGTSNGTPNLQIITPQPLIDERNNHKEFNTEPSPVYRARNLNNTIRTNAQRNLSTNSQETDKLITLNADIKINNTSAENSNASPSDIKDKKHRRRMTLRFGSTTKPTTTFATTKPVEVTTLSVDIVKQEIQHIETKPESLKDLLETEIKVDFPQTLPEVKRFYRSSAEKIHEDKEMAVVNNEKVQIVRPTPVAKLVGQYSTQVTIAKLDEAVLGTRSKKEVTIVTPRYTSPIEKT